MEKYEVIIIGGGPGGYVAAIKAAQLGLKVALIEKEKIGGTCLNRGCIPTKTLVKNAEIIDEAKMASLRGIKCEKVSFDINQMMEMKEMVVKQLRQGVEGLLVANKVNLIQGVATVKEKGIVEVSDSDSSIQMSYENLIIATGSKPALLDIKGSAYSKTSDEILNMSKIPQSIAIIGGGVIGCEFAHIFNSFGSRVTVIEALPQILSSFDEELTVQLESCMRSNGIKIIKRATVEEIEKAETGFKLILSQNEMQKVVEAEVVLTSAGRIPNIEGLEKLDLEMTGSFIKVDDYAKTSTPNVYAIGDVTGVRQLAHVASEMGIVAVKNIVGSKKQFEKDILPSCIFTSPEMAAVGLTEAEARKKYRSLKVGKFPLIGNGKALAMGRTEGMVKIIADADTNRIIGVHIMGPGATELISEGVAYLKMGATIQDIIDTIHAHPTVSEAIHEAALDAEGICIHVPPRQ